VSCDSIMHYIVVHLQCMGEPTSGGRDESRPIRRLHMAGATGSIPVPPTIQKRRRNKDLGNFLDRCCFPNGPYLENTTPCAIAAPVQPCGQARLSKSNPGLPRSS